jgi:hypothetical protein
MSEASKLLGKKTEMLDIHGKVKYIHAVHLSKYGDWNIVLYPDEKSLEVIRDLQAEGLKNVLKKDEDNQYFIQFRREPEKLMRGKMVAFTPPRVVIVENGVGVPFDGMKVGWGSDVTVRLEVRWVTPPTSTKQVPAARWDSLRVDNLVPYDPDKTLMSADELEKHKSLTAAKEPEPW